MPGIYSDTKRVRAVEAFLAELGMPTEPVTSFEARVTVDRSGDHVTVRYGLIRDGAPFANARDAAAASATDAAIHRTWEDGRNG